MFAVGRHHRTSTPNVADLLRNEGDWTTPEDHSFSPQQHSIVSFFLWLHLSSARYCKATPTKNGRDTNTNVLLSEHETHSFAINTKNIQCGSSYIRASFRLFLCFLSFAKSTKASKNTYLSTPKTAFTWSLQSAVPQPIIEFR